MQYDDYKPKKEIPREIISAKLAQARKSGGQFSRYIGSSQCGEQLLIDERYVFQILFEIKNKQTKFHTDTMPNLLFLQYHN